MARSSDRAALHEGDAMAGRDTYEQICAEMRAAMSNNRNDVDALGQVFIVADIVTTVIDGITGAPTGAINAGLQTFISIGKSKKDMPVPNPFFLQNGFDELPSPYTKKYLRNRAFKGGGASVISIAGTVASSQTAGVNVGGAAVDLNALGSTGVHMYKIIAIASSYKQTYTIADWCKTIMTAKTAKLAVRGGSLAGNVIPGGSLAVGVITAMAKAGVKLTLNNLVYATAAQIHWRAFQEQRISGGLKLGTGGSIGPASRLFWEIFTRRGATAIFGKYDIERLVGEPGGWQALGDKLMNL